jgi:hypothetical protein
VVLPPNEYNRGYLIAKKNRMGHMLDDPKDIQCAKSTLPLDA